MRDARQPSQASPAAKPPAFSPTSTSSASAGSTGKTGGQTNLISRPSSFPSNQTASGNVGGSEFTKKAAASNSGFSMQPARSNNSLQPQTNAPTNRSFQRQPPAQRSQPPIGDRTANRGGSPFSPVGNPANPASALTPQPTTNP